MVTVPSRSKSEPAKLADAGLPGSRMQLYVCIAVIACACAWTAVEHFTVPAAPHDDAFITFRYVDNAVAGKGLVYNEGQRVFGCSTPLYALALVAARIVFSGVATPELAVRLNLLPFVATGIAIYLLVRKGTGSRPWATAAALAFLLNRSMFNDSTGGMESFLFTALLGFALWAAMGRKAVAFGVLAGCAVLTRLEGAVLGLVWLIAFWGQWRKLAVSGAIGVAIAAAWFIPAWMYYGTPVPHSVIAKAKPLYPLPDGAALQSLVSEWAGWVMGYAGAWLNEMRAVIAVNIVLIGTIGTLGNAALRSRLAFLPAVFFWALLALYTAGNPFVFAWYWPPFFVCALVAIMSGLQPVVAWAGEGLSKGLGRLAQTEVPAAIGRGAFWLPGLIWLAYATIATATLPQLETPSAQPYDHPIRDRIHAYRKAAEAINLKAGPTDTLAAPEIGSLGYYYKGRILDACGLVSPEALPFLPVPENQRIGPGWGSISVEFVQATNPDWVVTMPCFAARSLLASQWFMERYAEVKDLRTRIDKGLWLCDDENLDRPRPGHLPQCIYVFHRR